jgi:hypothetical protein
MLRYLAITKPSLDGRKQDEERAPKKEVILDGAEPRGDEADPQVDDEDLEEQADNAQAKAIGDLVASVQQLQGELVAQKALVAKQVADTSKLHVSSFVQKTHHREAEKKAAMDKYQQPYQQGIKR